MLSLVLFTLNFLRLNSFTLNFLILYFFTLNFFRNWIFWGVEFLYMLNFEKRNILRRFFFTLNLFQQNKIQTKNSEAKKNSVLEIWWFLKFKVWFWCGKISVLQIHIQTQMAQKYFHTFIKSKQIIISFIKWKKITITVAVLILLSSKMLVSYL